MRQRTRRIAALTAACIVFAATARAQESAPDASREARERALAHLEQSRARFLAAIDGLSAAQWAWKPAADRWSVGECAEHIARSEPFLRGLIQEAAAAPPEPGLLAASHGKEETVLRIVVDRTQRFQAPEGANPALSGATRARREIERDFNFERGRTYELTASLDDLLAHARAHPAFEALDLSGWMLFLSGHTERHTLQIEEVKAAPGFPGS